MTDNNVVDFPGNSPEVKQALEDDAAKLTEEQLSKMMADATPSMIAQIDKQRAQGLERADKAVWNLDNENMPTCEPDVERRLRNLETGFRGLTTTVQAMNTLLNLIRSDVINALGGLEQTGGELFKNGAHLQVLVEALKEKEVLTEQNLKDTWERIVPPALEAMKKQQSKPGSK